MSKKPIWALISLLPVFLCVAQHSNGSTTNFSFDSFSQNNSQQLIYIGDANFSAEYGYIDITPEPNPTINISSLNETDSNFLQRIGKVLYHQQITMWPASFTTVFTIFVRNITAIRNFNGDGIAFIIVPDNKGLLANSAGAFLGLFNQSTDGNTTGQLAIEFDTFHNEFDPLDGNHVGIDIPGMKSNATANMGDYGMDIKAGRAIEVRVDYDGWAKSLQIYARYADNTSACDPSQPHSGARKNCSKIGVCGVFCSNREFIRDTKNSQLEFQLHDVAGVFSAFIQENGTAEGIGSRGQSRRLGGLNCGRIGSGGVTGFLDCG